MGRRSWSPTAESARAAAAESVHGGENENKKKMSKQKEGNMNFKKYERNKHCINGFSSPWPNELPSATVSAIHHYHRSPCVHYSLKTKGIFFGRPPNFYKRITLPENTYELSLK